MFFEAFSGCLEAMAYDGEQRAHYGWTGQLHGAGKRSRIEERPVCKVMTAAQRSNSS